MGSTTVIRFPNHKAFENKARVLESRLHCVSNESAAFYLNKYIFNCNIYQECADIEMYDGGQMYYTTCLKDKNGNTVLGWEIGKKSFTPFNNWSDKDF